MEFYVDTLKPIQFIQEYNLEIQKISIEFNSEIKFIDFKLFLFIF